MRGEPVPCQPRGNTSLPPCRVCGEPGAGFHYGVTTCGACKGFFRRSLIRKDSYVCLQSHLCQVGPSTSRRQSCPKCRYDKCLAVGMSKAACKVGRYSLLSNDFIEVLVEHQTALGNNELGSHTAVNKIPWSDKPDEHIFYPNTHCDSSVNGFYSYEFNDVQILHQPFAHETVSWSFEGDGDNSPNGSNDSTTSSHDSNDSLNIHDEHRITNTYDEYDVSMTSCCMDMTGKCTKFSGENDTPSGMREYSYTILESQSQMSTASICGSVHTSKTSVVDPKLYSPHFDMDNLTAFSPPLITHNMNLPNNLPYIPNYDSNAGMMNEYDIEYHAMPTYNKQQGAHSSIDQQPISFNLNPYGT